MFGTFLAGDEVNKITCIACNITDDIVSFTSGCASDGVSFCDEAALVAVPTAFSVTCGVFIRLCSEAGSDENFLKIRWLSESS